MLKIENIAKRFSGFELTEISLEIAQGDYFILLGNSGAGKTLLLEIIAGLVFPDKGSIVYENQNITRRPSNQRYFGFLFQDYALFPNLNVFENIAFALSRKMDKGKRKAIVEKYANMLGVFYLLNRKIDNLSGGEQQRVALARLLVMNPKVILLDEPLSSLDVKSKNEIIPILRDLNKKGYTIMHITHNIDEAKYLGNKIAVMDQGKIIQQGLKNKVLNNPANHFMALFLGYKNVFPVRYSNDMHSPSVLITDFGIRFNVTADAMPNNENGYIVIRNEAIEIQIRNECTQNEQYIKGRVGDVFNFAMEYEYVIQFGQNSLIYKAIDTNQLLPAGSEVFFRIIPHAVILI